MGTAWKDINYDNNVPGPGSYSPLKPRSKNPQEWKFGTSERKKPERNPSYPAPDSYLLNET